MSEAFGLTILEAMACGLPAIVTNYGGQTDFVNERNGWLIDYELKEVTWDLMYEGISWAEPNISDLRQIMRKIYSDKNIQEKSVESVKTSHQYAWDKSSKSGITTQKLDVDELLSQGYTEQFVGEKRLAGNSKNGKLVKRFNNRAVMTSDYINKLPQQQQYQILDGLQKGTVQESTIDVGGGQQIPIYITTIGNDMSNAMERYLESAFQSAAAMQKTQ